MPVKKYNTICLAMIVKNESKVIERCLTSTKNLIDYWIICDTGSTDGTQEIIANFFKKHNIKGELHQHKWKNFAYNRSLCMKLAKDKAEFIITLDADEVFVYDENIEIPKLYHDAYYITTRCGSFEYQRVQLANNKHDWCYRDVLHEYLDTVNKKRLDIGYITNIHNEPHPDGARSGDPNKFRKDALTLELAILDEPKNSRYVFYLAQSYRDCQDYDNAIKNYEKRSKMVGFVEETFYAKYEVGLCKIRRGDPFENYAGDLLVAYNMRPTRLEPVYHLVRYCRSEGKAYIGWEMFKHILEKQIETKDILFVDRGVYDYKLLDELSLAAYWSNHFKECKDITLRILKENKFPQQERKRMLDRITLCNSKLEKMDNSKPKYDSSNPFGVELETSDIVQVKEEEDKKVEDKNNTENVVTLSALDSIIKNEPIKEKVEKKKVEKVEEEKVEEKKVEKEKVEEKKEEKIEEKKEEKISTDLESIFTKIIKTNKWGYNGQKNKISTGFGNTEKTTVVFRNFLKKIIKANNIINVIDIGCGIWEFYHDEFDGLTYIGIDCVKDVIDFNKERYQTSDKHFIHGDILNDKNDIPNVDLCLIKDVLQHLSNKNIIKLLEKLKIKAKYIIFVQDRSKNNENKDIIDGAYRSIRYDKYPLDMFNAKKIGYYWIKDICLIHDESNPFVIG